MLKPSSILGFGGPALNTETPQSNSVPRKKRNNCYAFYCFAPALHHDIYERVLFYVIQIPRELLCFLMQLCMLLLERAQCIAMSKMSKSMQHLRKCPICCDVLCPAFSFFVQEPAGKGYAFKSFGGGSQAASVQASQAGQDH